MNTFQILELVSHGYIVVALDQPATAATVVFPDGHRRAMHPLPLLMPLIRASYMPMSGIPSLNGRKLEQGSIIPYLAQDVAFTLNQLAAINMADPNRVLTGHLDLQRIGAFGVSLGGIVVAQACVSEPRIGACLMMDAPVPSEVIKAGIKRPSMWITRDIASMRRERQRSGGWPEAEIKAHLDSMGTAFKELSGAGTTSKCPVPST